VKFTITLNADSAAFDTDDQDAVGVALAEVQRILAKVAEQISDPSASGGKVQDSNGNTVCTWTSEED
jgi:hypothetical protein